MAADWRARGELRYPEYLRLRELLALQHPVSEPRHHDETLFIVAHQVFELWFKLLLHELDGLRACLRGDDLRGARKLAHRGAELMRALTEQVRVLETMSALDFLEFRSGLEGASGFQSAQFRELEVVLGIREQGRVALNRPGLSAYLGMLDPDERRRVESRLVEPCLEDAFLDALHRLVAPLHPGRAYLGDVRDRLGEDDSEAAPAVLAALEEHAEVADEAALGAALGRLERLPLWADLGADEREHVGHAARRARLAEAFAKLAGSPTGSPEAAELQLLDEDLARRLSVPLDEVERALARAGCDEPARRAAIRSLGLRSRLRRVYSRDAHRPGPDDTFEAWCLAEELTDFAQSYQTFRWRHVKMVERMIGRRRGTGGSPGVAYLEQTLRYRVFPELWRVRTYL